MKHIIIALLVCLSLGANAQSTSPRWGTSGHADNTYRALSLGLYTLADEAGATVDTLTFIPGSNGMGPIYENTVVVTVTDSCVLALKKIGNCFKGDKMKVIIVNTSGSGHFVNFLGYSGLATKWEMLASGTKISLNSGKGATVNLVFSGSLWYEESRCIH